MKNIIAILKIASSLKRYYIAISIFTIIVAILGQLQPLLTKAAIDEISKLANHQQVNVLLVGIFAATMFISELGQTLISNISGYYGDIMSAKLQQILGNKYYDHILKLPQKYFDRESTGKIINRMNRGIDQISDFMGMMSNNFLQFIFSTILSLSIVAYFSWQVALMLLAIYPIYIWMTSRTNTKWQKYQSEINSNQDVASGRFAESIGQIRVVKSFLAEARELSFFNKHTQKVISTTYPQSRYWHTQDVQRRVVLSLIFLTVYSYIFIETARGTYGVGTMVLLIQYAALIRIPLFSISFLVSQSQKAVANTKDYLEVLSEKPEKHDDANATPLKINKAKIEFKDVNFEYSHGKPVLRGVSFTAKPGTKIALVGESGEGKTTITNLLLRLYQATEGDILIDDQNIDSITRSSLRHNIGVVFQDPALFSGTICENISYGNPDASIEKIIAAAKAANAHEFIEKLENGYNTEVGERGIKLSGGQKQRISIARAILKDAPILILDEATSSLDSKSEHLVQEALVELMKNRTTIIIAHRLSTIADVNQIVTIRGGRVDECGTPEQLASSGGIYSQLLKLQEQHNKSSDKQLKKFEISN